MPFKKKLQTKSEKVISFQQVNSNTKSSTSSDTDDQFGLAQATSETPVSEENYATLIDKNSSMSSSLFSSFTGSAEQKNNEMSKNQVTPSDVEMTIKSNHNDTLSSMATMVINDDERSLFSPLLLSSRQDQEQTGSAQVVEDSGTMVVIKSSDETDTRGGGGGLIEISEAERVRMCIQREVRQLDRLNDVLNGLSKDEIKLRLMYLDEQMERDIERLKLQYENKRNTILEIIEMKKKNAQIF